MLIDIGLLRAVLPGGPLYLAWGYRAELPCMGFPAPPPGRPCIDTLSPGRRQAAGSQDRPMSALLLALQVALLAARRLAPSSSLASLSISQAEPLAACADTQAP